METSSASTDKTHLKELQGFPQLSFRLAPGSTDNLDVGSRLKLLEDHISKCFEQVVARMELLEAETMRTSIKSQHSIKECLEEIPGLESLVAREDTNAHMAKLKEAALKHNCSAIATGLNTFIIDGLPFYRFHWIYQEPLHKRTRICCFSVLVLFFVLFVIWGFIKLFTPIERDGKLSDFVKISHEVKMWQSGELQTPKYLCVGELSGGLEVVATHMEIPNGQIQLKKSTPLQLVTLDVKSTYGMAKNAKCVTSQQYIAGSFGDPVYKYISFDVLAPENHSILDPAASIFIDTQVGALERSNTSYYYSFLPDAWTGVEVFIDGITLIKGDVWGVSRMMPQKYEEFWGTKDVAVSTIYTRLGRARSSTALKKRILASIYVRPSTLTRDDTYTPYGLSKLLMDTGGLWTSLAMVVATSMIICFLVCDLCPSMVYENVETNSKNAQKDSNDPTGAQKDRNDPNGAIEIACEGVVPAPPGSTVGRTSHIKFASTPDESDTGGYSSF